MDRTSSQHDLQRCRSPRPAIDAEGRFIAEMDSALDGKSSDKEEEDLEALPMAVARRGSRSLRHSFVDPKHRCCITFQGLSYVVPGGRSKKQLSLLTDITGYLRPGQMSALMGPSGSGKTSTLDILSGRKTVGRITGDILFSGAKPSPSFLQRHTGYVEQSDTLVGTLTVYEMLMYTAEMKRPLEESLAEKREVVDELIGELRLDSCRDVRIGSSLSRGISGGEAKRVNIGVALVTNPRVLFLDEPTSGLDSFTATQVMRSVKELTELGLTIVATVHSPTPACFALFDRLLLLVKGRTIYFGPNGSAPVDYFCSLQLPGMPAVQDGGNTADWITELTTAEDRAAELAAAFASSELRRQGDAEVLAELSLATDLGRASPSEQNVRWTQSGTATPWWWGIKTLLKYRTWTNYKDLGYLVSRIGGQLVFSFIYFSLYWKAGSDLSTANLFNLSQFLFLFVLLASFNSIVYIPALMTERALFVRERHDGLYTVLTFLLAKLIEELSLVLVCSLVYSSWVFYTVDLQGEWMLFWMVHLCTLYTTVVLAYTVAALSPTVDIANMALPVYIACWLFFMGALLVWSDIPGYWRWAGYLSFMRYGWGALMVNQFAGENNKEIVPGVPILNYYSLEGVSKWGWVGIEWAFFLFYFLTAFLALKYVRHVRR